ncbi:hypothetical protein PF005_g15334 [Phytophthora fragariae]|uniref:RxLR effector protein n=1 Tax=Phytophthora fragariae TaxID=53985 RepID=A0A6A3ER36_9STRA|nr:hypothetical protein PF003_g32274 [Phytophthora fragariae]KAE8933880.1 hypothetical protein PF009_g16123 [Phytophthora fragariae]KAE8988191.1 hypothetical protein PF011_g19262 [Phytophthora fragariae]KAE9089331.1 hypothetical protein PF010_g19036 [Phytophthora fragariae]KAE9099502.1 hypothetical protein PF007_g15850 [Phytophthora fragariae]
MRLSQVLVTIAASFLVRSEALSTSTDSKLSEVGSPSGPSQRLLRTHPRFVEDEDDSSEERGLSAHQWKQLQAYAENTLGIDWKRVEQSTSYLQKHPSYADYLEKFEQLKAQNPKHHGPNKVTYVDNY